MSIYRRLSSVTTAAASYNLTDLATVKLELKKTDKADDAILGKYIGWVSAAIATECGRVFVVETIEDKFLRNIAYGSIRVGAVSVLSLSRFPVVEINSLTINDETLAQDIDFTVDANVGQLIRLSSSGNVRDWGSWPIVVDYDAGYETLPGDLIDAAVRMVKNRFRLRDRDPYLKSENIPGVRDATWWIATGNEAGNLPPDVASMLDAYRVPVIA